jgi:DNA-binding GntR family transcriptional regulator
MARPPSALILEETAPIDRESFEPAYAQLARILRRGVATGKLRPGDQLPSESQLCQRYRISPMTVRRAVNILIDQGVVTAEQGRGTFVRSVAMGAATFQLSELQSLFSDPAHTGVQLLETRIVTADERIARKLRIPVKQRTIYIRRLLRTDGVPTFYHREYLVYDPARPIVESEMEVTSLQHLFSGSGETILKRGELSIEATLLTAEEADLLQAPLPLAAFCLEHLFYDFDDRPISWGWFVARCDRLRFTTRVGPLPE